MNIQYIDRTSGEVRHEAPPAEGLLRFLYANPIGRAIALPFAKRRFISVLYGRQMDAPGSVGRIKPFVEELAIDMTESKKSIDEFTSFNDFFYRELKPGARPIDHGLVSPGDGRLLAFERVADVGTFFVKGRAFTLPDFLKSEKLAKKFSNHGMFILRLAPNDYHRFHFPASGQVGQAVKIEGHYMSVSPYALARQFTRVFTENKRTYSLLESDAFGNMLIAPIGATMVGSIVNSYQPGTVDKGDEMGYFAFGGSTIVLLADMDKIDIDADLLEHTKNNIETYVRMGESIGKLKA